MRREGDSFLFDSSVTALIAITYLLTLDRIYGVERLTAV